MSKAEALHELYETCKDIIFDEADDIVIRTDDSEEKGFIRVVTDYFLQQKQKKVIEEKRFWFEKIENVLPPGYLYNSGDFSTLLSWNHACKSLCEGIDIQKPIVAIQTKILF